MPPGAVARAPRQVASRSPIPPRSSNSTPVDSRAKQNIAFYVDADPYSKAQDPQKNVSSRAATGTVAGRSAEYFDRGRVQAKSFTLHNRPVSVREAADAGIPVIDGGSPSRNMMKSPRPASTDGSQGERDVEEILTDEEDEQLQEDLHRRLLADARRCRGVIGDGEGDGGGDGDTGENFNWKS